MFYQNANSIYSNCTKNYVLGILLDIFAIDLLKKKSILQLAIAQYIEFGISLSNEFEIVITFE